MTHLRLPSADEAASAADGFRSAAPFPHVVWHDLIDLEPAAVAAAFPAPDHPCWRHYEDDYQPGKRICSDVEAMPDLLASLVHELNSPRALEALEALTGIGQLIPDPHLEGGGLHASGPGGILTPHTDFHIYARLGLYRRINLILYLSDGWNPDERGGALELYVPGAAEPTSTVAPTFGTCVVFQTDDRSPHGFAVPVPAGHERRSIALYYYTAEEAEGFSGDTNTYWQTHGEARGTARIRLGAYRALLFGSRSLSWLAHRANPRLGSRVRAR
ncbi:MAG: 2OG-Fe(II) oxygenase [Acidimicrobiales bacterium]|nr:2OG-Fe(II) oxygenase [Acidimicrobiales bacterium]HRW39427.1 2OG-Fe(II) oxygenase [Aquihabitans sp.]